MKSTKATAPKIKGLETLTQAKPNMKANPTPVRHHFVDHSGAHDVKHYEDETPPGPSSDTVLHSTTPPTAQHSYSSGKGGSQSPMPADRSQSSLGMFGAGGAVGGRTSSMSNNNESTGGPARSRLRKYLSPQPGKGPTAPPRPPSQTERNRPGSGSLSDVAGRGSVLEGVSDFGAELEEIGRINEKRLQGGIPTLLEEDGDLSGHLPEQNIDEVEEETTERETQTSVGKPIHVPYTPDIRAKISPSTSLHSHMPQKPMVMRDYKLLAEACQRAGRARMEGHAYYKMGELLAQNKDTMSKSVNYFKRYLNICRRLNDLQGEAKALNCLGITHQQLGGQNNYHIALQYHKQHAEIADAAGIFISSTNMGLIHAKLKDMQSAAECHKQALQYAVRAGDKHAESLALANLGIVSTDQGDASTAKVCTERHLELTATLNDELASVDAYEQLATLAIQRGDWHSACDNLVVALDIALRHNNQEKTKQLRCKVGVAQGMIKLDDHMNKAVTAMAPRLSYGDKK